MKKLWLIVLFISACSSKEKIEPPPTPQVTDKESKQTVYEGNINIENNETSIVLLLEEAQTGLTSSFEIRGMLIENQIGNLKGKYSTLQGAAGNEIILQLHSKVMIGPLPKPDPKKNVTSFTPDERELDLSFITEGGNKLVLVDEDFNRVADDNRYTLYKRSRLFTAEGYITFEKSHTNFYEQNAAERWIVAPLGVYGAAKRKYDSLASQEFEGIYLKALAYSVESDSSDEELLVIKSILEMKKSDAYTNKEKAAGLGYN